MENIWLYHINPKNKFYAYEYAWKLHEPKSIFQSRDRVWSLRGMGSRAREGDLISVFMKNLPARSDGVYVNGWITAIDHERKQFTWRPDPVRSARTLVSPVPAGVARSYFGRSYGNAAQHLAQSKHVAWLALVGKGEIVSDVPVAKARKPPLHVELPLYDPGVSAVNGRIGELHVLKILRKRYSGVRGCRIIHVSKKVPGADHDIAVRVGNNDRLLVEVKTRVGKPGDPVLISERELLCRRKHSARHSIFVVYLDHRARVRHVRDIDQNGKFALKPRMHWLFPGMPS